MRSPPQVRVLAGVGASLVTLFAACVGPLGHDAPGSARRDAEAELEPPDGTDGAAEALPTGVLSWTEREVALEADGRSATLSFELPAFSEPVFALRTYAADADTNHALCFQLEDVHADAETEWVPPASSADYGDYCMSCAQRVAPGSGFGLFILPSAVAMPTSFRSVSLRVALRDCLTLTPLSPSASRPRSLVVESASFAAPATDQAIVLPIVIAEATPHTFAAGARLDLMFARLREIWSAAGIELVLRGPFPLPRPAAPVTYSATDRAALAALDRQAKSLARAAGVEPTAPIIVLTPCLVREDAIGRAATQPLATTAHVPGGFAVNGEPDGIFVAGERCGGLTPGSLYLESESLAAVLAHELGHYLGLFHVRESDQREDVLADTSPAAANLMQWQPSAHATALAESQISIARRHPALAVPKPE